MEAEKRKVGKFKKDLRTTMVRMQGWICEGKEGVMVEFQVSNLHNPIDLMVPFTEIENTTVGQSFRGENRAFLFNFRHNHFEEGIYTKQ